LLLATALLSLPFMVPAVQAEDDDPTFTEAYLKDRVNIDLGHKLFTQQCSKCHGKGAYPGKAPKLKPHKLTPEDVYLRITYGFRKMPPWEEVFSQEERMALTAYVKSDIFSN
jgi:mono/diheme cytochrome c family protein